MEPSDRNDEVITSDNRIVGCRGRVLVAVLVLAVLALILVFTLFYRLFTWTPPVPRQAATDVPAPMLALVRANGSGEGLFCPVSRANQLHFSSMYV